MFVKQVRFRTFLVSCDTCMNNKMFFHFIFHNFHYIFFYSLKAYFALQLTCFFRMHKATGNDHLCIQYRYITEKPMFSIHEYEDNYNISIIYQIYNVLSFEP